MKRRLGNRQIQYLLRIKSEGRWPEPAGPVTVYESWSGSLRVVRSLERAGLVRLEVNSATNAGHHFVLTDAGHEVVREMIRADSPLALLHSGYQVAA